MDNKEVGDIVDNSNNVTEINNKENEIIVEQKEEIKETQVIEDNTPDNELTMKKEQRLGFKNSNKKNKRKGIFIALLITIIILLSVSIYACANKLNPNVYNNIYVYGHNIGGYSSEQVKKLLNEKNNIQFNDKIDIFQDTETIYTVLENDVNLKIDINQTVNNILNYGRTGNIFKDNFDILLLNFKAMEIEPTYLYDENKLDEIVRNIDLSIKDRFVESKYSVDETNKKLVITVGKSGNGIDFTNEKHKIINEVKKNYTNENSDKNIYLDIITKSDLELDVDEVYNKVKREPKDAYIDKSSTPVKIVSEVVGIDINKETLKETLESDDLKIEEKVIELSLEIVEPKVKLEDLDKELYRDKLAGYTTYFDPGQYARSNNLRIALEYLNGKVIMPGEIFSYNDAIGDTNAAKGYLSAATFKGGTTVNEMGGGICQTTSTLYNVALMANLEIVERHQHGLPVGYVQPSRDATVYSPYLDFKFKNTKANPIKIVTSYSSSGNLNISLYGIKENNEYEVELISQYLGTIPYKTKYVYDNNMNEGEQVVISKGVNGYYSQCFIRKKLNGVEVSYDLLSKDTYNAQQQIIKVGTKGVNIIPEN